MAAAERRESLKLKCRGKDCGEIQITKADVSGVEDVTKALQKTSVSVASRAAFVPNSPAAKGDDMFLEYVQGGCELNVAVAIDFTGSNGDPRIPGTLHYLSAGQRNDYEKAISAILDILGKYDTDKRYPVWGFGAKYGGEIQHCFQCGGADEHVGVQGVLDAYHSVFKSGLVMSGPTVFDGVIRTAGAHAISAQQAAKARGGQCYSILLILTDGAVSDPQATARSLEEVYGAPLSVVIVGVGGADFRAMQFLDDFSGRSGKRDIVQFVEFNKHRNSSHSLTSATLDEIPSQLTGYFQSLGIQPLPGVRLSDSSVIVAEEEPDINLSLDIRDEEIVLTGGGDDFVDGFLAN
jgi:Copine